MSLEHSDAVAAKDAPSPSTRVSLADLRANIAAKMFVDVDGLVEVDQTIEGGTAVVVETEPDDGAAFSRSGMTLCIIWTRCGFVLVGSSATADLANFDRAKGRHFAEEDAIRQLWPLMGYALKERLPAAAP